MISKWINNFGVLSALVVTNKFSLKNLSDEALQQKVEENYQILRPVAWDWMKLLYSAAAYGPEEIEGPALIVFPDNHMTAPDPWMLSYLKTRVTSIYKKDLAPNSKAAEVTGGIVVEPGNTRDIIRRLQSAVHNDELISLFPFTDVHDAKPNYSLINIVLNFNTSPTREEQIPVNIYAATVIWKQGGKELDKLSWWQRFWPTYWPIWFKTQATLLLSDQPITTKGVSLENIVDKLKEDTERLRKEHLQSKQSYSRH